MRPGIVGAYYRARYVLLSIRLQMAPRMARQHASTCCFSLNNVYVGGSSTTLLKRLLAPTVGLQNSRLQCSGYSAMSGLRDPKSVARDCWLPDSRP